MPAVRTAGKPATSVCRTCHEELPADCFRARAKDCSWCAWADPARRARARWGDIQKRLAALGQEHLLRMDREEFVAWYVSQPDRCHYCGLTRDQAKRLRLRVRGPRGGYIVGWDIDRLDPALGYQAGNVVLACAPCNTAKGAYLTAEEARVIGRAMGRVWHARLRALPQG